jgi:threonylcarbamoyladenosine tRNA methylthiotransferase MtaB
VLERYFKVKISILTLGCKVNQAESFQIEGALKTSGHSIVDISEKPDFCIINTCTVTSKSDYQSRQLIRKAQRVGARVIVTGCYSELNKDFVKSMAGVEDVIENDKKLNIINKLSDLTATNSLCLQSKSRCRLFIKIQDGCNYSCSYCTIPMARGRSRSIDPDTIVDQVNEAVYSGYNEIVLTGIHLGIYGHDLKHKVKLSDLLITILNKTKINRIRLSSLEVKEIDDGLLDLFTDKRICNHLHIPLQSGDNKILKLMNRVYNSEFFSRRIEKIHKRLPNVSIGTDVIIGFPGEGEPEFKNTYHLLERLPITYMHLFPFSPRPRTLASKMADSLPFITKKNRMQELSILNKKKKDQYLLSQVGNILEVLIEDVRDGKCIGTSGNYLKTELSTNSYARNSLIHVKIQQVRDGKLIGIPV